MSTASAFLRDRPYLSKRLAMRSAIGISAVLLVALVVLYVNLLRGGTVHVEQTDLLVYYSASHLVAQGHGDSIYNFPAIKREQKAQFHALQLPKSEASFLYPPYYALALAPLALLSFKTAYVIWLILNCVLLALILAALRRYALLGRSGALLLWFGALSWIPVFSAVVQGQSSILLTALLAASFFALRSDRQVLAGCFLACAMIKPYYPLLLLLVFLLQRRLRVAAGFVVTAAFLALVPLPVLGPSINQSYGHLLVDAVKWNEHLGGFAPYANHNLVGFTSLLLTGSSALAARIVFTLVTFIFVVWCSARLDMDRSFAVAVLAGILIAPHVNLHDLTLVLIPIAIALRTHRRASQSLALLLVTSYVAIVVSLRLITVVPVQLSVVCMIALALWLYVTASAADRAPVRPSEVQPAQRELARTF